MICFDPVSFVLYRVAFRLPSVLVPRAQNHVVSPLQKELKLPNKRVVLRVMIFCAL
jgi:hypothetical protein